VRTYGMTVTTGNRQQTTDNQLEPITSWTAIKVVRRSRFAVFLLESNVYWTPRPSI
jgi:hypothetical protein